MEVMQNKQVGWARPTTNGIGGQCPPYIDAIEIKDE
jgi:hypothetical protein